MHEQNCNFNKDAKLDKIKHALSILCLKRIHWGWSEALQQEYDELRLHWHILNLDAINA